MLNAAGSGAFLVIIMVLIVDAHSSEIGGHVKLVIWSLQCICFDCQQLQILSYFIKDLLFPSSVSYHHGFRGDLVITFYCIFVSLHYSINSELCTIIGYALKQGNNLSDFITNILYVQNSWPILYGKFLYKMSRDFLDIQ